MRCYPTLGPLKKVFLSLDQLFCLYENSPDYMSTYKGLRMPAVCSATVRFAVMLSLPVTFFLIVLITNDSQAAGPLQREAASDSNPARIQLGQTDEPPDPTEEPPDQKKPDHTIGTPGRRQPTPKMMFKPAPTWLIAELVALKRELKRLE